MFYVVNVLLTNDLPFPLQLINKYDRPWLPDELRTDKPAGDKSVSKDDIKVEVSPIKGPESILQCVNLYNLLWDIYVVYLCSTCMVTNTMINSYLCLFYLEVFRSHMGIIKKYELTGFRCLKLKFFCKFELCIST